jgi:hypothetical protein
MEKKTTKKAVEKATKQAFEREVAALVSSIHSNGLAAEVVSVYDSAQDIATCYDEYAEFAANPETQEKAEWFAHDHAIEKVWVFLVNRRLITAETKQQVVDFAYSEIS